MWEVTHKEHTHAPVSKWSVPCLSGGQVIQVDVGSHPQGAYTRTCLQMVSSLSVWWSGHTSGCGIHPLGADTHSWLQMVSSLSVWWSGYISGCGSHPLGADTHSWLQMVSSLSVWWSGYTSGCGSHPLRADPQSWHHSEHTHVAAVSLQFISL